MRTQIRHRHHDQLRRIALSMLFAVTLTASTMPTAEGSSPSTPTGTAPPASDPTPTTQVVTLFTGDRVSVTTTPGKPPAVWVTRGPDTPGGVQFQIYRLNDHIYVIPSDATGYIGGPLDLSLFDVTTMLAQGYGDTTRPLLLHVDYSHAPVVAPADLRPAGRNLVRQDRAAADTLGAALGRHWQQDRRASMPKAKRLFAGITKIALAGASATPAPAQPADSSGVRFDTLTVRAFDRNGNKDTGDLAAIQDVDSGTRFNAAMQTFYRGQLSYSVPPGNYDLAAWIFTPHAGGGYDETLAVAPEVHVDHDMTVTLRATSGVPISVQTPRPTVPLSSSIVYQRDPAQGSNFLTDLFLSSSLGGKPPQAVYVTPTAPVSIGALYFYPYFRVGDPTGGTQYLYDMEFPTVGRIPSDVHYDVAADQLATIDAGYHSPIQGRAERESRSPALPFQGIAPTGTADLVAPLSRTEYVLPLPGQLWIQQLVQNLASFQGQLSDVWRSYQPGTEYHATWSAQPMVPGLEQEPVNPQLCPVCRFGNSLFVDLRPFTDAGGHFSGFSPDRPNDSYSLQLFQDGSLVGTSTLGTTLFPLSSNPADYRLVDDIGRSASWWPTSTHTHTEWTFSSAPRAADALPPGWVCPGSRGPGGSCSFEHLLFVDYQTNAGDDDVIPGGTNATIDLHIHHQMGDTNAAPVSDVSVAVSFDDGTTWTPVTVTPTSDGSYQVSYPQPPIDQTSGFASLRVVASDTAGDSIDQTITRAYQLAVTPPPPPAPPAPPPPSPTGATQRACATPASPPYAQCMALIRTDISGLDPSGAPNGYGPADLQNAYNLPVNQGTGRTVAIVDAFDDPNAEADLAVYRAQYGLPPCTIANGCLRKLNQRGDASPLPQPDPGWAAEISLDLDMVSAACPNCRILLIEADSSSASDLGASVDTAVSLGPDAVSNSYGSEGEFPFEQDYEHFYHHPGTAIVVSSGDYGYGNGAIGIGGVAFPAVSNFVTAVGGTTLRRDASPRGWTERAWAGSTSGCSAYVPKPDWQQDPVCGMRTVADVAAVSDPATGVAVYDTYVEFNGWLVAGGTSAAAPIIASVYALAGGTHNVPNGSIPYAHPQDLYDVTSGTNGADCLGTYLCSAGPGYDGPTGLGTPDGVGAFTASN